MGANRPKVRYDREADIFYILVREGPVKDTVEVAEDIFIELDEDGKVAGIEIWRASQLVIRPVAEEMAEALRRLTEPGR